LGSGAMTNSMKNIAENANSIMVIVFQYHEQHPVFGSKTVRLSCAGVKLIVADPAKLTCVNSRCCICSKNRHRYSVD
jgi:predicted molibdopterin-dependent oxidoreductase YjgC